MFRFRLTVVIVVSFGFVLVLGVMLYWGANQGAINFQRNQTAFSTLEKYERLSQDAYRYFKQQMDLSINSHPMDVTDVDAAKRQLYQSMEELRVAVVKPVASEMNNTDLQAKPLELERVARLTAFLDACEYRYKEVERLRSLGQEAKAIELLAKFSEDEIDAKFQPMIDTAISSEQENAWKAGEKLAILIQQSRWIGIIAAFAAVVLSLMSGLLLLRGMRTPIQALLHGTDEIASGNMAYRILLDTHDEFAYLAKHFNAMAEQLEVQQEKLRESRSVLESRVAERTFELHRLNAELKRMDCARREFLADIGHELRTPITVIRGEAEVTLRGADHGLEEYKDALTRIVELSRQLSMYVNDLLFLARSETASLQFAWDKLDLSELLKGAIDDFQVMSREAALTVTFAAPTEPVWILGDKQRIRQVMLILGDNACRYSKPGGEIHAALWVEGSHACFSIQDQGIGIPSQDLERIFDRRFRSNNALYSREEGSGLGLPMAKSILSAHDGVIKVASVENTGSTFTVTLPLYAAQMDKLSYTKITYEL